MRRVLLLALMVSLWCGAAAAAGGITFSTTQSDYTVQIGSEAAFPVAVENTIGADAVGMLIREVRFVPGGGEESSSGVQSQSRTMTVFRDTREITVSAGTTAMPGTYFFDIAFEYGNTPRTRIVLPEIRVHVVSTAADEEDQQNPQVSSVSAVTTSSGTGASSASSSGKQPGQMMQDTASLQAQAAREQDRMQAMRSALLSGLEDDPLVKEIHTVLTSHGYARATTTVDPDGEGSGTFSFEYRGGTGDTIRAGGRVLNGTAAYAAYVTGKSLVVPDAVVANETCKQHTGELADAGFFPVTSSMNATPGASFASIGFTDSQNRTARIIATLSGGEVREVALEEPSDFIWLAGAVALCIILAIAYLVRRAPKAPVLPAAPVPCNPSAVALQLLDEAQKQFERGERKEAYGTAARALRSYLSHAYGTGMECADSDAERLLRKSGNGCEPAVSILGRCAAVSYARSLPENDEFLGVIRAIRACIGQS